MRLAANLILSSVLAVALFEMWSVAARRLLNPEIDHSLSPLSNGWRFAAFCVALVSGALCVTFLRILHLYTYKSHIAAALCAALVICCPLMLIVGMKLALLAIPLFASAAASCFWFLTYARNRQARS